jgi:NDP-sugar pyrophosphorylase family protein
MLAGEGAEAFILAPEGDGGTSDLARPLAGAPLLVRQLEWLRMNGIETAVVNRVPTTPLPRCLSPAALAATGVSVTWIPSAAPLSASELVARVVPKGLAHCIVPHARLGNIDLRDGLVRARESGNRIRVWCRGSSIEIWPSQTPPGDPQEVEAKGWLFDVSDERTAHALVETVLSGIAKGLVVRGSQVAPGIYRGHGSVVESGAELTAPCYIGAEAYVGRGARLGPGAVLDSGAVVEEGAEVIHARVASNVVVGQGLRIERACATGGRIELHGGRVLTLDDDLLIGDRGAEGESFARLSASIAAKVLGAMTLFGKGPRSTR